MTSKNGHDGPERVALYLRVSSEEQRDRETIEIQREFLEQYCELYSLEVVETYADNGVSGTLRLHERPEGRRLLDDAAAGRFGTVIVYRLDRLGRKLLVTVEAHDSLQEAGVALKSATEAIDTSTPSGRLIFQMLASFAEYDRHSIIERTHAGQRRAYKNGRHGGAIPYGYDIAPDGSFVVVEEEAAIVREIITNIAEGGASAYAETKRLNAEGVPSPGTRYKGRARTNGESWADSSVRHIVNQRAYSGTHVVKLAGGEAIERPVPAIVSPALQAKAQQATARNMRFSGGKPGREYLLRSLVYCERCGVSYVGASSSSKHTGKRYSYYSCSRRKRSHDQRAEGLTCPHIGGEWLEALVWADVRTFVDNPGEVLERVREQGLSSGLVGAEAGLGAHEAERLEAASTEAWLLTLRERLAEVEADTEEGRRQRRELVELLVERITVSEQEDGSVEVHVTYRFGEPVAEPAEGWESEAESRKEISHRWQNAWSSCAAGTRWSATSPW